MSMESRERRRVSRENSRQIRRFEKDKKRARIPESEYLTTMRDPANIIEFDDLHTYFFTDSGTVKAVDGVSFSIPQGSTIGVVGESGCGKSVTSLSLMRLVQGPAGQIVSGAIRYNRGDSAVDLTRMPLDKIQQIRGNEIAMIFQEPMTSLNPVFTIGAQIDEAITLHNPRMPREEAKNRSIAMLKTVGIARPEGVYKDYPHELSGGMRQRVMIAMALSCSPRLIIADEPTTALDVTIQAQILDLLRSLKSKVDASIMLITHDLGVVAEMADFVIVMYAGRVIESGTAREIYLDPRHPYTIGLLNAKPQVNREVKRLYSIPGQVPSPIDMPNCCYFRDRCEKRFAKCDGDYPGMFRLSPTHYVACWLSEGVALT